MNEKHRPLSDFGKEQRKKSRLLSCFVLPQTCGETFRVSFYSSERISHHFSLNDPPRIQLQTWRRTVAAVCRGAGTCCKHWPPSCWRVDVSSKHAMQTTHLLFAVGCLLISRVVSDVQGIFIFYSPTLIDVQSCFAYRVHICICRIGRMNCSKTTNR